MILLVDNIVFPKNWKKGSTGHDAYLHVRGKVDRFHKDIKAFDKFGEGIPLFILSGEIFNQGELVQVIDFHIKKPEGLSKPFTDFINNHQINQLKYLLIF